MPIPIFATVAALAKGIKLLAYQVTLLTAETYTLRKANEALSKHCKAKKNCIHQRGALTIEDAHDILAQKEVDEQIQCNKRFKGVNRSKGNSTVQRCSTCKKTSYNMRTYQEAVKTSSLSDSK